MSNVISSETDKFSNQPVYTLADLSNAVKRTVEANFEFIKVRGEISKPAFPNSGHVYFSLKDVNVSLASVIWKGQLNQINIQPEEGMDVICTGKLTTFAGQSRYQLNVIQIEFAGEGALLKQLEALRLRLQVEGLFSEERKKEIPYLPTVIGVVTSPTGAVIRDIVHRLSERFGTHVLVAPVPVQGKGAEKHIASAIAAFNVMPKSGEIPKPDVIIVARGGGSLEDLWCFNEEIVVRAVSASIIPIISAVGHETDTTLIDYAADMRAPTPTAAAEIVTPVLTELVARVLELDYRASHAIDRKFQFKENLLTAAARGLIHPVDQINLLSQRIDVLNERIEKTLQNGLSAKQNNLINLFERIPTPFQKLADIQSRLIAANEKGKAQIDKILFNSEQTILRYGQLLDAFSFKRVLEKGFALVTDSKGVPVKKSEDAPFSELVNIKFFDDTRLAQLDPTRFVEAESKNKSDISSRKNKGQNESKKEKKGPKQPNLFKI